MFDNKVAKFLVTSLLKQRLLLIRCLILAFVVSILEGFSTSLVMPLLQILTSGDLTINQFKQVPKFIIILNEFYASFPSGWQLPIISGCLLLLTIFKNISQYLFNIAVSDLQLRFGLTTRRSFTQRFLELELPFYSDSNLGELLSYVSEQTQRVEALSRYVIEIIREILLIFILLFVLINISPALTILTTISLLVVFTILKIVLKYIHKYGREAAKSIDNFSSFITEMLSGIRVIKSFNSEYEEKERANRYLQSRYVAELTSYKYKSLVTPLTETSGITILLLIIFIGTKLFSNAGSANLPFLLTFSYTLLRMIPRINQFSGLRSQIISLSGSLESIYNFLSSTEALHLPDGQQEYKSLSSGISFDNIVFTYPSNSIPTIRKVSLNFEKGTTTALVGSSGSGKSTLVDLIMRFYDPESGCIKIDDIDLRKYKISSWRKSIAMVSQDTFLFHASIRENIAYGSSEATEFEIIEAAKRAYAYDFIQELPQGFDTIVGERGTRLSGGQRQRIAIARAILRDPDVLILDEATSALDSNSEQIVQKAIEEVSCNRTVIIIAHRLSTIEQADKIVVMDNGRVIEEGSHRELLTLQGKYWSLYKSQASIAEQVTPSV